MEVAEALVGVERQIDALEAQLAPLNERAKKLKARVLQHMEDGEWPDNARVSGATVYLHTQVWAGPLLGHDDLTAVLNDLGLFEYTPKTVNSQSLSAFVREHDTGDKTASLEERFASLDPELKSALKISEKITVKVTGA